MGTRTSGSGSGVPNLSNFSGDIKPDSDLARFIGSEAKRWAAIFAGIVIVAGILVGGVYLSTTDAGEFLFNTSGYINGSLVIYNNLTAGNASIAGELEVGGISVDGDCIAFQDNNTRICTYSDYINMSADGETLLLIDNVDGSARVRMKDGSLVDVDKITSLDLDTSPLLWGRLRIISNTIESIATQLELDSAESPIILSLGGNPAAWVTTLGLVTGPQLKVNNSYGLGLTTTATMIIDAAGGTYDARLLFENEHSVLWHICMDDSVGDSFKFGAGAACGTNTYLTMYNNVVVFNKQTSFSDPVNQFEKSSWQYSGQSLPKDPTSIGVEKGGRWHTDNTVNTVVTSITSLDGQFFTIACEDTFFEIAATASIHLEGGGNIRCNRVGDTFICMDYGSYVTCSYTAT